MRSKHSLVSLFQIRFLLVMFLFSGLVLAGCTTATVPRGWSGGVMADSKLYIGSMTGQLVAVNTLDGNLSWSVPLEAKETVAIYGSPAVAGDLIYVGGYNGKVFSFVPGESQADRVLEKVRVGEEEIRIGPIVGSVVFHQGQVYFGSADGKVYAVNARLQPTWSSPFATKGKIWSTPAVNGDTLYIGSFDKKLYALNAKDGSKKWEFQTEGAIVATPLVHDNTVYVGSFDRYLYAVDATSGSLRWKFLADNWFWAKPVVYNNVIYAASLDGKVYALDAESGRESLAPINLGSPVSSSPVLAGNSLIVATQDGEVYGIDAATNQERWRKDTIKEAKQKIYAALAVNQGVVYIHADKDLLYTLNAQSGAELRSPVPLKSVPASPSPSPSSAPSGGTNWGLIIGITVVGIVMVMVFRLLGRRREV